MLLVFVLAVSACKVPSASDTSPERLTAQAKTGTLDPKKPVTITLWHYYVGENQQALEEAVFSFNQTIGIEQGVIIDPVAQGSIAELEESISESAKGVINSDPMPDIFSSYPDKVYEIDQLGLLCDLNAYFTEEEKAQYVPHFFTDGVFSDERFLLAPIVKSTELMYVNATEWDAFKQATGATDSDLSSWESISQVSRNYYAWTDEQTPDVAWDGKGFLGFDSVANYIIIGNKQLGVEVIDAENEEVVLDEEVLRTIFDLYCQGIALGSFDEVGKFRSDDIKSGALISYVGSSSSAAYFPTWIEKNNTQTNIDFLPLSYPVFSEGSPYAIQQGAGMCVSASDPQKQEGAVLFLKWFTEIDQNIEFATTTGYLPVKTDAYESSTLGTMMHKLQNGEKTQQNIAAVYEIALHQITEANTYAIEPFEGSYEVRSLLQKTLTDAGNSARQDASVLKEQGATESEIITFLDFDARFHTWLDQIRSELDARHINYRS